MAVAIIGLVFLAPLLFLIAVAVKLNDGGPILYKAKRVGRGGQPFFVYKFRSMVPTADRLGAMVTKANDDRVTAIGRILRHYKLDELPQMLNVLRGEMSLVGPRPEDPKFVERYTREQRLVLEVTPGLTSPASLYFRHEERLLQGDDWENIYTNKILPRKLAMELEYMPTRTFKTDLAIIIRTLGGIIR